MSSVHKGSKMSKGDSKCSVDRRLCGPIITEKERKKKKTYAISCPNLNEKEEKHELYRISHTPIPGVRPNPMADMFILILLLCYILL